jgi:lipid A disaccharide synthetase
MDIIECLDQCGRIALYYWIAKRLVTIPYVSLPNIIAGEYLVPELIQDDANPDNIAQQAIAMNAWINAVVSLCKIAIAC